MENICYSWSWNPADYMPDEFKTAKNIEEFKKRANIADKREFNSWEDRIYYIDGDGNLTSAHNHSPFGMFVKRTCYDLFTGAEPFNEKKNVYINGVPNNFNPDHLNKISQIEDKNIRDVLYKSYKEEYSSVKIIVEKLIKLGANDMFGYKYSTSFDNLEKYLFYIDGENNIRFATRESSSGKFIQKVCKEIKVN